MDTPLLTVKCFTYNQEKYIRQTLEGFVMQQTSFPYEVIVHDDASTDGTPGIVREYAEKYPRLIKPVLQKENLFSKADGSLGRAMEAASSPDSRYIAFCEGDDYWIDPLKLQKQVDFLESHPDYNLVYTDCHMWHEDGQRMDERCISRGVMGRVYSYKDQLMKAAFITPCSWVGKRHLFENYEPYGGKYVDNSFPLALEAFATGKVHFLDEVCVVYRVLAESGSHIKDGARLWKRLKGIMDIQKEYMEKYPVSASFHREVLYKNYTFNLIQPMLRQQDTAAMQELRDFFRQYPGLRGKLWLAATYLPDYFLLSFMRRHRRWYYKHRIMEKAIEE